MGISSKDYLLILLGIIGTLILSLTFGNKLNSLESFSLSDILLLTVIGISAIVYFIYKRLGEIENDIDEFKKDYIKLNENLKKIEDLINIKVDIIELQKEVFKNGKKR